MFLAGWAYTRTLFFCKPLLNILTWVDLRGDLGGGGPLNHVWYLRAEPAVFEAVQGDSGAVPCCDKNTMPAEITENNLLCLCV